MRSFHALALVLLLGGTAASQQPDTAAAGPRPWDAIRTDPAVPAFERGREFAIEGRFAKAETEFRKGLRLRRAVAQFNLGILSYGQGEYWVAYKHFRKAYRMKQDPVFHEYLLKARQMASSRAQ